MRISGSVTISISGAPERLKSTSVVPAAVGAGGVTVDELGRVLLEVRPGDVDRDGPSEVSIASRPPTASGMAYWLIW